MHLIDKALIIESAQGALAGIWANCRLLEAILPRSADLDKVWAPGTRKGYRISNPKVEWSEARNRSNPVLPKVRAPVRVLSLVRGEGWRKLPWPRWWIRELPFEMERSPNRQMICYLARLQGGCRPQDFEGRCRFPNPLGFILAIQISRWCLASRSTTRCIPLASHQRLGIPATCTYTEEAGAVVEEGLSTPTSKSDPRSRCTHRTTPLLFAHLSYRSSHSWDNPRQRSSIRLPRCKEWKCTSRTCQRRCPIDCDIRRGTLLLIQGVVTKLWRDFIVSLINL